jgi:hypothetical protein
MAGRRVVVVLLAVVSKCQCFLFSAPLSNLPRLQLLSHHQRTALATSTVPQSDSVWGPLEQVSHSSSYPIPIQFIERLFFSSKPHSLSWSAAALLVKQGGIGLPDSVECTSMLYSRQTLVRRCSAKVLSIFHRYDRCCNSPHLSFAAHLTPSGTNLCCFLCLDRLLLPSVYCLV